MTRNTPPAHAAQADSALAMAVQRELRTDERLLWQGHPLPRISLEKFAIYFFAIPWTAFALFWTTMAAGGVLAGWDGIGWIGLAFPLFGLPFIAIGASMLSVPFLPLFLARRTIFAITDKRLLRIVLWRRLQTRSVAADSISHIDRTEASDGSGTISMVVGHSYDSDGDRRVERFEIGEVADVMAVETQVRQMAGSRVVA